MFFQARAGYQYHRLVRSRKDMMPGCPVDVLEAAVVQALNSGVRETRVLLKPKTLGTFTCCA